MQNHADSSASSDSMSVIRSTQMTMKVIQSPCDGEIDYIADENYKQDLNNWTTMNNEYTSEK